MRPRLQFKLRSCLRDSLKSAWVNYEIGIFAGQGTRVFLYDPEDLLSNQYEIPGVANVYGSHIGRYLPAYRNKEDLISALHGVSPYADMCLEENAFITRQAFMERVTDHVETVIALFRESRALWFREAVLWKKIKSALF